MSVTLPEPMVPADVDLRDFRYMPLEVRRLRDSRLVATRSAEEALSAILLWSAAWHQVPAGSIPDDDSELSQLAGYGRAVKEWLKVRNGALHGFVLCSDGRWYHPVVAEKAIDARTSMLETEWRKSCDRARKENKEREARGESALPMPAKPLPFSCDVVNGIPRWFQRNSAGIPAAGRGIPDLREGKGREQKGSIKNPEADDIGSSDSPAGADPVVDDPPPIPPPDPDDAPTRRGALALTLRSLGVRVTSVDDLVIAWADELGVTLDEAKAAVAKARVEKPYPQTIPPKYLDSVIRNARTEGAAAHGHPARRDRTPSATDRNVATIASLTGRRTGPDPDRDAIDGTAERVG